MNICNIKTRRATQAAIKALEGILPTNVATACIVTNNGYGMDFSPKGEESVLYKNLSQITGSTENAIKAKALIYSNVFREWFGDWTDEEALKSVAVDTNGEPQLYYYGTDNVTNNEIWRPGAIYYPSVEDALAHNQYAIPVYLNVRVPLDTDFDVISPELGDSTVSNVLGSRTVFNAGQVMRATEQDVMFDRSLAYNISPALRYQNLYNILQGNIVAWSDNNIFKARKVVGKFNRNWRTNFGIINTNYGFKVIKSNYFGVLQDSISDDIIYREDKDYQRVHAIVDFLHEKFPNLKYQFLDEPEYIHELNQAASNYLTVPNSFIKGDTIYFSKLRVTTDIAAEEFLHPLVYTLKYNNPDLFYKLHKEAELHFSTLAQEINWVYNEQSREEELVTQALARTFRQEFETQPRKKFLDYIQEFFAWVKKIFTENVYFNPDLKKFFLTTDNLAVENLQQLAEILNTEDTYIDVWPVAGSRANWRYDRATIGPSEAKYVTEETRPVLDSKLNISAQDAYEITSLINEIYKIKFDKKTSIKVTDEDYWNKLVPVLNQLGLADYASEIFLEGGEKDGDDFYIDAQAAKLLKQLWDKVSKSKDLLKFTNDFVENYYVDDGIEKGREAVGLRLQYRYNDARQLSLFDEPLPQVDNVTSQELQGYVNHSGGAVGSDTYWGEVGARYGVTSNHYYHENKTPNGNVEISQEDYLEGQSHVLDANETLHRKPEKYMNLLARNWAQVKYSDAVFAIGHLTNGIVDGGTGWAVQMAIDARKPVYLFDQIRNQWFKNLNGTWATSDIPVLTPNFAGIGTRELNDAGKRAIEAVYAKTLQNLSSNTSSNEIKPLVIVSAREVSQKAREIDGIDTLRHPNKQGMHYGNPFTHDASIAASSKTPIIKVNTVKEAVEDYEMWLRGIRFQDIEPERRQWILDQIESGQLDDKPLVYYTDKIPDRSYGRTTYDYYEAPNHAHILQKLIFEHQQSSNDQQKEIREAVTTNGYTAWQVMSNPKEQKLKDFILYVTGSTELFNRLVDRNNTKQDREKAFREVKEWMKAWQAREAELLELGYSLGEVPLITEGKAKGHYNFREFFHNLDIRHSFGASLAQDFIPITNYQKHAAEAVIPKIYRTQLHLKNTPLSQVTPQYFERVNNYYRSEFNDVEVIVRTDGGKFSISKVAPQNVTPAKVIVKDGYRVDKQGNRMYMWPKDATLYIGNQYGEECIVLNTNSDNIAIKEINQIVSSMDNVVSVQPIGSHFHSLEELKSLVRNSIKYNQIKTYDDEVINVIFATNMIGDLKKALTNIYLQSEQQYSKDLAQILYNSFQKSLNIISTRIPTQDLQSFMAMKVVGFTESEVNDVFVTRWQLWLQGSKQFHIGTL